jgi:hypothetical protein
LRQPLGFFAEDFELRVTFSQGCGVSRLDVC